MKRFLTCMLALLMCVGLSGCGDSSDSGVESDPIRDKLKEEGYKQVCWESNGDKSCAYRNDNGDMLFYDGMFASLGEGEKEIFDDNNRELADKLGIDLDDLMSILKEDIKNYDFDDSSKTDIVADDNIDRFETDGNSGNNEQNNSKEISTIEKLEIKSYVKSQVDQLLISPSSAEYAGGMIDRLKDWEITANGNFVDVYSYVDSENGFGAMVRTNFYAQIERNFETQTMVMTYLEFDGVAKYGTKK